MKIFISHQKADAVTAGVVAHRLWAVHGIETYLDVIDPYVGGPIEALADHIRSQMGKCTQLLAVVSSNTAQSQWVPWEVGVATEKDFPLATYSQDSLPPEFLRKWPYLRSHADLDAYARISKRTRDSYVLKKSYGADSASALRGSTRDFYSALRAELRQS